MAVESVDRSNQSQTTQSRSAKDSYDDKERDLTIKHRQEMADLQRKHQKSVDALRTQYDQALSNLRDNMRQTMSEREKAHMKDVQEIQDINKRRFAQTKSDDDQRFNSTKDALEGELARARDKDQADQDRLTKQYETDANKRDEQDQAMEAHYRQGNQEALEAQRKRIQDQAEADKNDLRKQIAETKKQKDMETKALRHDKEQTVENLHGQLEYQKESLGTRYREAVAREKNQYQENVKYLEDNFRQSLQENKDKFYDQTQKMADQYSSNFNNLRGSVNGRIEGELEPAKREVVALREQNYNDRLQAKHQKDLETTNLRSAFGKNIDELENRRQGASEAAHQEKTRALEDQQRRHDRNFQHQTAFYATKLNEQEIRHQNNFDQKVEAAERESQMTKMKADQINKKIFENYSDKTVQQEEFFDEQAHVRQEAYDKRMSEQRANLEKQKYNDINAVQNQLAKESIAHQEKLMDTVSNYEKQMSGMRADYEKRLKRQNELFREQTEKQVKGLQMDREASEAKLQARISSLKDTYERELDQLRKRQAVERQELAAKKGSGTNS